MTRILKRRAQPACAGKQAEEAHWERVFEACTVARHAAQRNPGGLARCHDLPRIARCFIRATRRTNPNPNGPTPLFRGKAGMGLITFNKACPWLDVFTPTLALPLKEGGNVRACRFEPRSARSLIQVTKTSNHTHA